MFDNAISNMAGVYITIDYKYKQQCNPGMSQTTVVGGGEVSSEHSAVNSS